MKNLIIAFILIILVEHSNAQNSPWPMFQHDMRHTGQSSNIGPTCPVLKWVCPVKGIPGNPVIAADGTIYVPTGNVWADTVGYLYAIKPDGTIKWEFRLDGLPSQTSPAIGLDGTIYLHMNGPSNLAAIQKFYAINPNGTLKWLVEFNAGNAVFVNYDVGSPVIGEDGTIYTVSGEAQWFYAFNPNGSVKWSYHVDVCEGSPAIGPDGTIYVFNTSFNLFAFNPDGTLKWQKVFADVLSANPNSPSIGIDGIIYIISWQNKKLYALNPDKGEIIWAVNVGSSLTGPYSTPAIASNGTIYISDYSDRGLCAYNSDGTLKWNFSFSDYSYLSPMIDKNGTVNIFISPGNSGIYAINPDGSKKFYAFASNGFAPSMNSTPIIGIDGTLYVTSTIYPKNFNTAAICYDNENKSYVSKDDSIELNIIKGDTSMVNKSALLAYKDIKDDIGNTSESKVYRIYPNPIKNILFFNGFENEFIHISIISIAGKLLKQKNGIGIKQIELGDLQNGVYILKIINSKGIITTKIIKQ